MDLTMFIFLAIVYIMVIHFAMGIANYFNVFIFLVYFIIGGVIGWYLGSYLAGFVFAMVVSFILWNDISM